MRTKILPLAALTAVLGVTAAPALAKELRTQSLRPPPSPVQGLPGATARAQAVLAFPTNWRVTSLKKGVLVMREGTRSCQYTVRASVAVAAGDAADAAARAAALTPVPTSNRVLETGTRNSAAWRVTRPIATGHTRVVAVRVDPLRFASQQAGAKLWLQTTVTADSDVGDECHAGTWRDVAAPTIGDALATARTAGGITTS
jgi:hypothetical protein